MNIKENDIIKVKRDFAESDEDEKTLYRVLELRGDRVLVIEKNTSLSIQPTFVFKRDWIEISQ